MVAQQVLVLFVVVRIRLGQPKKRHPSSGCRFFGWSKVKGQRLGKCRFDPFSSRLLTNISQDTTIHIEHVTIDSIRGMRSQEHGGAAQFLRL